MEESIIEGDVDINEHHQQLLPIFSTMCSLQYNLYDWIDWWNQSLFTLVQGPE